MDALRGLRLLLSAGALALSATAPSAQTWPMQDGSHDVLHGFQQPFHFLPYLHEGVDLRGSLATVVAMRGGTVEYVDPVDAGGTLVVRVDALQGGGFDSYQHVLLDPWLVGDTIAAGDVVGVVSNSYFFQPNQDHVQINRFADIVAGTNGYELGRGNMRHPLLLFTDPADRDPQLLPADMQDANEDGAIFEIVLATDNAVVREFPFGIVDLLLEATDRQTSSLYWNQGITSLGYWIEAVSPGADVRSAAEPYRLFRFDDAWRPSVPDADALVPRLLVSNGAHTVSFGPDNTQWTSLATYKLTNTRGTTGSGADVLNWQAWRTGLKLGTATEPNGIDGLAADEIHEAQFPDGRYLVHALIGDLEQETERTFETVVDNFRPYVRGVRASLGGALLYEGSWTFDATGGTLDFGLTFARPLLGGPRDLVLEIVFSEPMETAELVATTPALGFLPPLTTSDPDADRKRWTASIPARELRNLQGRSLRLSIAGTDLNQSTLHVFGDTGSVSVPFNKRTAPTGWDDATTDELHVIPIPDLSDELPDLGDGGVR